MAADKVSQFTKLNKKYVNDFNGLGIVFISFSLLILFFVYQYPEYLLKLINHKNTLKFEQEFVTLYQQDTNTELEKEFRRTSVDALGRAFSSSNNTILSGAIITAVALMAMGVNFILEARYRQKVNDLLLLTSGQQN